MSLTQPKPKILLAEHYKGARMLIVSPTISHNEVARKEGYIDGPGLGASIYSPSTTVNPRATLLNSLKTHFNHHQGDYGISHVLGIGLNESWQGGDGVIVFVNSDVINADFSRAVSEASADIGDKWPRLKSEYLVQDSITNVRYINGQQLTPTVAVETVLGQTLRLETLQPSHNEHGHLVICPMGEYSYE